LTKLTDIRIDEATWATGSRERRLEWRVALREILEEHRFEASAPALAMLVTYRDGDVHLAGHSPEGERVLAIEVPRQAIVGHLDEYLSICKEMSKLGNAHAARYEALDIAKRLVHDDAADTLLGLCRVLRPDLSTCRRFFTLFVTLYVDTTRLAVPHHRR
jgi:uncharacterized protein (UPF0262 family)